MTIEVEGKKESPPMKGQANGKEMIQTTQVEVLIHVNRMENPCKSVSENVDGLRELINQLNHIQKECNCHCTLSVNV